MPLNWSGAPPPSTQPALAAPNSSNLRRPSPTLNLDKVAFIDALNFVVRDSLGLNMYVNWPAIEAAGKLWMGTINFPAVAYVDRAATRL